MPYRTSLLSDIITALLILLFLYTAFSKLLDFQLFKIQLYQQTLSHAVATGLIYTLPFMEIFVAGLLFYRPTRIYGLFLSTLLMLFFTGYIALILLNYFGRVPCSCGGVINALGWKMHFAFNLFFLLLSIIAILISYRERRLAISIK